MIAAVNTEYGPPSVIKIREIPAPVPARGEILIKIKYAGANRTDAGFMRAKPPIVRLFSGIVGPKYSSLGCEFSGVVETVGSKVSDFKKGDKVFGFDDKNFGAFAEYKVIKANKAVYKIPEGIPTKHAGVATEGAHYALYYLKKIKIPHKAVVFVNGGTGAIGSAAIQLLKEKGAYVYASSTTAELKLVKKLGADQVVDWQAQDITSVGMQFDVFFDSVGKSSFKTARKILKPGGIYMSSELGKWGQNPILSLINPIQKLFTKRNIKFPIPQTKKEDIKEIARVLKSRKYTPVIDREYHLKDVPRAMRYVETGQKVGNVVIKVN